MSETPAPGFHLTPQSTFPTTEDARASYGFAQPEAQPDPLQPEAADLRQQLAEAVQRAEDATATVRELLAEFYAGGAMAEMPGPPFDAIPADLIRGVNQERQRNNAWVAMKCRELGVPFPPVPRPKPS